MKLMLAKLIYIIGIAIALGLSVGTVVAAVWIAFMLLPIMGYLILLIVGLFGYGLLFGWAESHIEESRKHGLQK
jgi:hypothetical protein